MSQQVSVEAAMHAFRQRHGELADENVLLKARVAELEAENRQLRDQAQASGGESRQENTQVFLPAEQLG